MYNTSLLHCLEPACGSASSRGRRTCPGLRATFGVAGMVRPPSCDVTALSCTRAPVSHRNLANHSSFFSAAALAHVWYGTRWRDNAVTSVQTVPTSARHTAAGRCRIRCPRSYSPAAAASRLSASASGSPTLRCCWSSGAQSSHYSATPATTSYTLSTHSVYVRVAYSELTLLVGW